MCPLPGTGDFDYGHTLDADTIRISTIVQAPNDVDETGVGILISDFFYSLHQNLDIDNIDIFIVTKKP